MKRASFLFAVVALACGCEVGGGGGMRRRDTGPELFTDAPGLVTPDAPFVMADIGPVPDAPPLPGDSDGDGIADADEAGHGTITVVLKYGKNRQGAFVGMRRRSRPGRRVYVGVTEIPKTQNGIGISILSTSSGIMTDRTAREKGVGGELLCEVW